MRVGTFLDRLNRFRKLPILTSKEPFMANTIIALAVLIIICHFGFGGPRRKHA